MSISKRFLSIILVLVLAISIMIPTASAAFSDVSSNAWYAGDVNDVQQYGILKGVGNNKFNPSGNMTLAEAITLTARTYAYSHGETIPENYPSPWYWNYVQYANEKGVCSIGELGSEYNNYCNRLTMAKLFARVLTNEQTLNNVTALPDVQNNADNESVFYLYNQGVLTGSDEYGSFNPYSYITRAEAAAILNRVLNSSKRKPFVLSPVPEIKGTYYLVSSKSSEGDEYGPDYNGEWIYLDGTDGGACFWKGVGEGAFPISITENKIAFYTESMSDPIICYISYSPNLITIYDDYGTVEIYAKEGSKEEKSLQTKAQAEYDARIKAEQDNDPWYGLLNATMMQAQAYFSGQVQLATQIDGYDVGELGYIFHDIDEDGIPELLVGFTRDVDNAIRAIYTVENGHAVCLAVADMLTEELGPYSGLELGGNGTIVKWTDEYNASFATYYRLSNGELNLIESVAALYGGDTSFWHSTTQKSEDFYGTRSGFRQISESQFNNLNNKYNQYTYQFNTDW